MPMARTAFPEKMIHIAGIDVKPAYVFPTHEFFAGNNAAFSPIRKNLSVHLKYGFKFAPDTYFGRMYLMLYKESEWGITRSSILPNWGIPGLYMPFRPRA